MVLHSLERMLQVLVASNNNKYERQIKIKNGINDDKMHLFVVKKGYPTKDCMVRCDL